jgi:hypothetical protein
MGAMMSEDLYRLRLQTIELRRQGLAQEAEQIATDIKYEQAQARDCLRNGDTDGARYADERLMELESDYNTKLCDLHAMSPQQGQLTQAKADYIQQHASQLQEQHWSGIPGVTNLQALGYAHDRALQLGIPEDSEAYFQAIDVLAPQTADTLPTPDEIARGCGISGREYNAGVRRLWHERKTGQRRD